MSKTPTSPATRFDPEKADILSHIQHKPVQNDYTKPRHYYVCRTVDTIRYPSYQTEVYVYVCLCVCYRDPKYSKSYLPVPEPVGTPFAATERI